MQSATSATFELELQKLSEPRRAEVVGWCGKLKAKLMESISAKMKFWYSIPWRLIAVFYVTQGGDVGECKRILRTCIDTYDKLLRDNLSHTVHRVAHVLLSAEKACGRQLRQWLVEDKPLEEYFDAYVALLMYALIPLVERAVEALHARMKRFLRGCSFVLPPTLCSMLREEQNLELLRSSSRFHQFCIDTWNKRRIADLILQQRNPLRS